MLFNLVATQLRNESVIPIRTSAKRTVTPVITILLILANVWIFLYQQGLSTIEARQFIAGYGLIPARYSQPELFASYGIDPTNHIPLLTSTFLHGGWLHVIVNMWTLWLFGGAVEGRMGRLRFLVFYGLCGILASTAHLIVYSDSMVPVIGASGAVSAVLGAYATLFARTRVILLVPILFIPLFLPLPILLYAAGWFSLQLLQGAGALMEPELGGSIAWWAHIGGFLAGLAVVRIVAPPTPQGNRQRYDGPWG